MKSNAEIVTVFRVKACVCDQIHATSDDVVCCECWAVTFAIARRWKWVAVIAVVSVGLFIPARQSIRFEILCCQTDAHVTIASLRYNLYFEIIQTARSWNRIWCTHGSSIVVWFSDAYNESEQENKQNYLFWKRKIQLYKFYWHSF